MTQSAKSATSAYVAKQMCDSKQCLKNNKSYLSKAIISKFIMRKKVQVFMVAITSAADSTYVIVVFHINCCPFDSSIQRIVLD